MAKSLSGLNPDGDSSEEDESPIDKTKKRPGDDDNHKQVEKDLKNTNRTRTEIRPTSLPTGVYIRFDLDIITSIVTNTGIYSAVLFRISSAFYALEKM